MSALAFALALVLGVGWLHLALLAASLYLPVPTGLLLVVLGVHRRRVTSPDPATFCDAVGRELRGGSSVHQAISHAAESVGAADLAELCRADTRLDVIGRAAAAEFAQIGEELGAVIHRRDGLGVHPAVLFDELSMVALSRAEVAREVAIATAPARATAIVLLVTPVGFLIWLLANGELANSLTTPEQRAAALAGLTMVLAGLVIALVIVRRSG
ncbi:MAG: hypothetical protein WCA93_12180 [Acidimicrobiia bacterium]